MGAAASSHQSSRRAAFQANSLGGGLSQSRTNGKSAWGTLLAPLLPMFLQNNPLPNGFPWSTLNTSTNYYDISPNTGVIRAYDFTISRGLIAPDGYQRETLLVNGAFPGPLIEANWGDTIQVTVHNNITAPEEGSALHWHGFLQKGTPWEDGVPAVTQCPIAPGKTFTYSFQATLYGTTWYHSHYSAQYAAGLLGPMVIHGPKLVPYDIDLGPIMVSDWYHDEYFKLVQKTMSNKSTGPFPSDNNLINGKMNFDCSTKAADDKTPCVSNAGISKFKFQRGKKHRLRLVNVGAEALQRFSIDGHNMTVIANDFVLVKPYETDVVALGIGQRADVIVEADQDGDAFWMRSNASPSRACAVSKQRFAYAAVYYDGADETQLPTTQANPDPNENSCLNDDLELTEPLMIEPAFNAEKTYELTVDIYKNKTGFPLWHMNEVDYRGNYNSPTLLLSKVGNYSFEPQWNVIDTGNARTVRVVLKNKSKAAHPMHLHGFNMQVLHVGTGDWDGTIVRQLNPQRRDVYMMPASGHIVLQFNAAGNAGVWPFHCHIAWHVSAGFMVQFLTNPNEVRRMKIPQVVAETCREWGTWTNTNIPNQIDSGL